MDPLTIRVTGEQVDTARTMVMRSLEDHHVANIWDKKTPEKTEQFRMTGSLGEIVFADAFGLPRPSVSFGATDGQDYGIDFEIPLPEPGRATGQVLRPTCFLVNVKTMHRKSAHVRPDYALNIPVKDVERKDILTDIFYHISLVGKDPLAPTHAVFVGYVHRDALIDGVVGIRRERGDLVERANGTRFTLHSSIYEVPFGDLIPLHPAHR